MANDILLKGETNFNVLINRLVQFRYRFVEFEICWNIILQSTLMNHDFQGVIKGIISLYYGSKLYRANS